MRVPFSRIFNVKTDGSVSPKTTVIVRGVTMRPSVPFGKGAFFGGIEIAAHIGKDLEIEYEGGTVILKSIYP